MNKADDTFSWAKPILLITLTVLMATFSPALYAEDDDEHEEEEREYTVNDINRFLAEKLPRAKELLENARKNEPVEDYQELLERARELVVEYHEMREYSQQLADSFIDLADAELELDSLEKAEGVNLEARVKALTEKAFDIRLTLEKAELARLQIEVREIEAVIKQRERNREKIIQEEVRERLQAINEEE